MHPSLYRAQAHVAVLEHIQLIQMPEAPHYRIFLPPSVEWMHLQQQIRSVHSRLDSTGCSEGNNTRLF